MFWISPGFGDPGHERSFGFVLPKDKCKSKGRRAIVKGQMSKICADCMKTQINMTSTKQKSNY